MDVQTIQNRGVTNQAAANAGSAALDKKKQTEAAKDFESLLLAQMLKSMHEEGSNWLGTGDDQSTDSAFGLAEQQLARTLVSGGGLGLSKLIESGLAKKTQSETLQEAGAPLPG